MLLSLSIQQTSYSHQYLMLFQVSWMQKSVMISELISVLVNNLSNWLLQYLSFHEIVVIESFTLINEFVWNYNNRWHNMQFWVLDNSNINGWTKSIFLLIVHVIIDGLSYRYSYAIHNLCLKWSEKYNTNINICKWM